MHHHHHRQHQIQKPTETKKFTENETNRLMFSANSYIINGENKNPESNKLVSRTQIINSLSSRDKQRKAASF